MLNGRILARLAVAGVVAVGTPMALAGTANAAPDSTWDQLAQCESGGKWGTNTGNGFAGGLQFSPSTWSAYGGSGSASSASREQQIAVAERVLAAQGWGAWPSCSSRMGLSGKAAAAPKAAAPAKPAPKPAAKPAPGTPAPANPAAPKQAPATAPGGAYTVRPGDTLSQIAIQLNVPGGWQALYERNKSLLGSDPNVIQPGQQLATA